MSDLSVSQIKLIATLLFAMILLNGLAYHGGMVAQEDVAEPPEWKVDSTPLKSLQHVPPLPGSGGNAVNETASDQHGSFTFNTGELWGDSSAYVKNVSVQELSTGTDTPEIEVSHTGWGNSSEWDVTLVELYNDAGNVQYDYTTSYDGDNTFTVNPSDWLEVDNPSGFSSGDSYTVKVSFVSNSGNNEAETDPLTFGDGGEYEATGYETEPEDYVRFYPIDGKTPDGDDLLPEEDNDLYMWVIDKNLVDHIDGISEVKGDLAYGWMTYRERGTPNNPGAVNYTNWCTSGATCENEVAVINHDELSADSGYLHGPWDFSTTDETSWDGKLQVYLTESQPASDIAGNPGYVEGEIAWTTEPDDMVNSSTDTVVEGFMDGWNQASGFVTDIPIVGGVADAIMFIGKAIVWFLVFTVDMIATVIMVVVNLFTYITGLGEFAWELWANVNQQVPGPLGSLVFGVQLLVVLGILLNPLLTIISASNWL